METDVCEFKTFVDNSLLGQNQKDAIMNIWTNTLNELTAEIKGVLIKNKLNGNGS